MLSTQPAQGSSQGFSLQELVLFVGKRGFKMNEMTPFRDKDTAFLDSDISSEIPMLWAFCILETK